MVNKLKKYHKDFEIFKGTFTRNEEEDFSSKTNFSCVYLDWDDGIKNNEINSLAYRGRVTWVYVEYNTI